MDKMRMESVDMTAQNIEKIGALFPNCITETADENGKLKKAINFKMLEQMLSDEVAEGDEAYEFTWVGKKAAIVEANKPIRKTLRPCKEESVNWDTTENLYIEGDNLEVLKLLQESYLGAIKMIYIDPPYNTGNDFIYRDDFKRSTEGYEDDLGVYDEDGNRMFKNTDSNGRFHSDWCSMIYSRLMLARNLLSEDGVIFISIDDNEIDNLRKICDEVFGEENHQATITWRRKRGKDNSTTGFSRLHEYVVVYSKQYGFSPNRLPMEDKRIEVYTNPDNDPKGPYVLQPAWASGMKKGPSYSVELSGYQFVNRMWLYAKETLLNAYNDGRLAIKGEHKDGMPNVYLKVYLSESKGIIPDTIWADAGNTGDAVGEIKDLFDKDIPFGTPKPLKLMDRIIRVGSEKDSIVLDFFSGSATTAHAIMQLNTEDNGCRKYIMVQVPEKCEDGTDAKKAGFNTICDIGKERIRRAGKKIKEDSPLTTQNLDTGFRVLKLDETNMTDVYYAAGDYTQDLLSMLESNVKADRTDLDLLFGCLLEWGLPLSLPYSSEQIDGCTVHNYNDGDLIACFDENVPDSVIKEIAKRQPLRAVFRDSSFANSPSKINVGEIFKLMAPDTRVKVI